MKPYRGAPSADQTLDPRNTKLGHKKPSLLEKNGFKKIREKPEEGIPGGLSFIYTKTMKP